MGGGSRTGRRSLRDPRASEESLALRAAGAPAARWLSRLRCCATRARTNRHLARTTGGGARLGAARRGLDHGMYVFRVWFACPSPWGAPWGAPWPPLLRSRQVINGEGVEWRIMVHDPAIKSLKVPHTSLARSLLEWRLHRNVTM